MATVDRKRTIKSRDYVELEGPTIKRQKKAPVRPDMLDPTLRGQYTIAIADTTLSLIADLVFVPDSESSCYQRRQSETVSGTTWPS